MAFTAANTKYAEDGTLGVDLSQTIAGTGPSNDQGNQFPLGKVVKTRDGGAYMYVHASDDIAQFDAVGIDENYEAAPLTNAMAQDGWKIGFAQVAIADNAFGWVALTGSDIGCNVLTSCAADKPLYTSGTAGKLDDGTGSGTTKTLIKGVVAVNAVTAATSTEIIANYPHVDLIGVV